MLNLLLGEDIYAKQGYLEEIINQKGLEVAKYSADESLPKLASLAGQSLFGAGQLHIFLNCISQYELAELQDASNSKTEIIFIENSLDKRLTKTKELLKIVDLHEFPSPNISSAPQWVLKHAETIGINIQPIAANELVKRLMGETKQTLSVLSAHQELLKLSSFADGNMITKEMVEELTVPDLAIDLFTLLDSMGNKNKSNSIKLLQQYYDVSSEDDKVLTIRLSALLADQFRSLLIVRQSEEQGLDDKMILAATGWKSGRLFIMKKLSKNFTTKQLIEALSKFYNLEIELKNSTLPPRVVIDMIVATI